MAPPSVVPAPTAPASFPQPSKPSAAIPGPNLWKLLESQSLEGKSNARTSDEFDVNKSMPNKRLANMALMSVKPSQRSSLDWPTDRLLHSLEEVRDPPSAPVKEH